MKRDLDLIRQILLDVESAPGDVPLDAFEYEGKTSHEIGYHIEMLENKGYIDAKIEKDWGGDYVRCIVHKLTWDGADYLDSIRSDRVWSETKRAVGKSVGTTTMEVIRRVAADIALKLIQEHIGV